MRYLIDGHNLIPHIPGLSLSDPDDEEKLIELLGQYSLRTRDHITVFFDKGSPSHPGVAGSYRVKPIFVPANRTADGAIAVALNRLKGEARNQTVVSSDRQVQTSARYHHAKVIESRAFASMLNRVLEETPEPISDELLSEEEVRKWEDLFNQGQ